MPPSLIDQVGEAVAHGLVTEIAKLPAMAVRLITELVTEANASDDPQRHVERRLTADGAHLAAQATVDAALAVVDEDPPPTTIVNGFPKAE